MLEAIVVELEQRRKDFVSSFQNRAATQLKDKAAAADTQAIAVDIDALRRSLATEAAHVANRIQALLASITLPHLSFSLLPYARVYVT